MRIVLNCAIEQRGISGTARVTRSIAQALETSRELELVRAYPSRPPGPSRVRNALKAATWDLVGAARSTHNYDLLLSPCNVGRAPRRIPHLLVVQDTMVLDHPQLFDKGYVAYARALFGISVMGSTTILTASKHSATSIEGHWKNCPPIEILPWPTSGTYSDSPRSRPDEPFTVLMVGATEPHKNQLGGIEGVRIARLLSGLPLKLRIVGPIGRAEATVRALMEVVDPRAEWCTRIVSAPDMELERAYADAAILLQPSLDEGFGLPLLEAAAHALPVIHSGAGSMSEVHPTGDVGSTEPTDFAHAICGLLVGDEYRNASINSLLVAQRHSLDDYSTRLRQIVTKVVG